MENIHATYTKNLTEQALYPIVGILQLTDKLPRQLFAVDLLLEFPARSKTAFANVLVVIVITASSWDAKVSTI